MKKNSQLQINFVQQNKNQQQQKIQKYYSPTQTNYIKILKQYRNNSTNVTTQNQQNSKGNLKQQVNKIYTRTESSPSSMLEAKQLSQILNKEKLAKQHDESQQEKAENQTGIVGGCNSPSPSTQTQILDLKKFLNQKKCQSMQMGAQNQNQNNNNNNNMNIQSNNVNSMQLQNNNFLNEKKNVKQLIKKNQLIQDETQIAAKKLIEQKSEIKSQENKSSSNQQQYQQQNLEKQPVVISMFQEAALDQNLNAKSQQLQTEKQSLQNPVTTTENKVLAEISHKINNLKNQQDQFFSQQQQQLTQQYLFSKKEKNNKELLEQITYELNNDNNQQNISGHPYNLQIPHSTSSSSIQQQNFQKAGRGAGFYNLNYQQQQQQTNNSTLQTKTSSIPSYTTTTTTNSSSIVSSVQGDEVNSINQPSIPNNNNNLNHNKSINYNKQNQYYRIPQSFSGTNLLLHQEKEEEKNKINNKKIEISFSQNSDNQCFDKKQLEDFLNKLGIVLQHNKDLSNKLDIKKAYIQQFYQQQTEEITLMFDFLKNEIELQKNQFKDILNYQQQEVLMSFCNYDTQLKQAQKIMNTMQQDIVSRKEEILSNIDLYPKRFNLFLKQYQKKLVEQNQMQENIQNQQIILKKFGLANNNILSSLFNTNQNNFVRKSRSVSLNSKKSNLQQNFIENQDNSIHNYQFSQLLQNQQKKNQINLNNDIAEKKFENLIQVFKTLFNQIFIINNQQTNYTDELQKDLTKQDYCQTQKQNWLKNSNNNLNQDPLNNKNMNNFKVEEQEQIKNKFHMPRTYSEQHLLTRIDLSHQLLERKDIQQNKQKKNEEQILPQRSSQTSNNGLIKENLLKKNNNMTSNLQISFDNIDLFLNSQKKLQSSQNNSTIQNNNNITQELQHPFQQQQPQSQQQEINIDSFDSKNLKINNNYTQITSQQTEAITPKSHIKQREQRECHSLPPTKISDFSFLNQKEQNQAGLGSLDTFFNNNNLTTQKSNQKYLNLLEKISSNQVNTQNFYSCFIKSNKGFLSPDNARIQQIQSPTTTNFIKHNTQGDEEKNINFQQNSKFTNSILPHQLYTPQNYPNLKVNTTQNLINHQKDMAQFYNILEQKLQIKQQQQFQQQLSFQEEQQEVVNNNNNNELVNISSPEYTQQIENNSNNNSNNYLYQQIQNNNKFKIDNSSYQKTLFCSPHFKESKTIIEQFENAEEDNS